MATGRHRRGWGDTSPRLRRALLATFSVLGLAVPIAVAAGHSTRAAAVPPAPVPGTTTLVSSQPGGGSGADQASVSRTGRYVAYTALAEVGPPPVPRQVFLVDRLANTRTLVSVALGPATTPPTAMPGDSDSPSISADGSAVAFHNRQSVAGVSVDNVYVYDVASATARLVSAAPGAATLTPPTTPPSDSPRISPDGRFVVYHSQYRDTKTRPQLSGPGTVDFGAVVRGTSTAPVAVTVRNTGDTPLNVGTPTPTGPDAAAFTVTTTGCDVPLAPRTGSCQLNVTFAPRNPAPGEPGSATLGDRVATLLVGNDGDGGPLALTLVGTATLCGPGPCRTAELRPKYATGSGPLTQTATTGDTVDAVQQVTNNGSVTVQVNNVFVGADSADFFVTTDVIPDTPCAAGLVLAPNATCSVRVHFRPQTAGLHRGGIQVTRSAPGSPLTIPVLGQGLAQVVALRDRDTSGSGNADAFDQRNNSRTSVVSRDTGGFFADGFHPTVAQVPGLAGSALVAFDTPDRLAAGDTDNQTDVYTQQVGRDGLPVGAPLLASVGPGGASTTDNAGFPSLSEGNVPGAALRVAYVQARPEIEGGPLPPGGPITGDVFVRDLVRNVTVAASNGLGSAPADDQSGPPALSLDGRTVAFASLAGNLASGDRRGTVDTFVRDLGGDFTGHPELSFTEPLSLDRTSHRPNADGSKDGYVLGVVPAVSGDGRYAVFTSERDGLDDGGIDTNGKRDVFVRDRTPQLSVSMDPVNFFDTRVGTTSDLLPFTVTNTGNGPLQLGPRQLTVDDPETSDVWGSVNAATIDAPAFRIAGGDCAGAVLFHGESCTYELTFTPTAVNTNTGTLTLGHTGKGPAGSALTPVRLVGTGIAPGLVATPSPMDFLDQPVGTPSFVKDMTVTNTGNQSLHLGGVTTSSPEFAVTRPTGGVACADLPPSGLASADTCRIGLTFTPSATGLRQATLTFNDDTLQRAHTVLLVGTGTLPGFAADPNPLDFDDQQRGQTSGPFTMTVRNTGAAPMTISTLRIDGPNATDYAIASTTCTGAVLQPSDTCDVVLRFTPSDLGLRDAVLVVNDDAPGGPHSVPLIGNGVAPGLVAVPSPVDFGIPLVGSNSEPTIVAVRNAGTHTVTLDGTIGPLVQGDPADFTISTDPTQTTCKAGLVMAPAARCEVVVTFKPASTDVVHATLLLTAATDQDSLRVPMIGQGAQPVLDATPKVVRPGGVAFVTGKKFPAGKAVTLTWNLGVGTFVIPAAGPDGSFGPVPVLVFSHDQTGQRKVLSAGPGYTANVDVLTENRGLQPPFHPLVSQ